MPRNQPGGSWMVWHPVVHLKGLLCSCKGNDLEPLQLWVQVFQDKAHARQRVGRETAQREGNFGAGDAPPSSRGQATVCPSQGKVTAATWVLSEVPPPRVWGTGLAARGFLPSCLGASQRLQPVPGATEAASSQFPRLWGPGRKHPSSQVWALRDTWCRLWPPSLLCFYWINLISGMNFPRLLLEVNRQPRALVEQTYHHFCNQFSAS